MSTSTRTVTTYYYEELAIPFEADVLMDKTIGNRRILGALSRDVCPSDPLVEFDEGDLCQFNHNRIHDKYRPSVEEFKEILRENKRRVFYVRSRSEGYDISHRATIKNALEIEDADGYYIVPDDAGNKESYAKGVMEQYSAWCEGEVYGVCIWVYEDGELVDREAETWGYYGYKVAEEELKDTFEWYVGGEMK